MTHYNHPFEIHTKRLKLSQTNQLNHISFSIPTGVKKFRPEKNIDIIDYPSIATLGKLGGGGGGGGGGVPLTCFFIIN